MVRPVVQKEVPKSKLEPYLERRWEVVKTAKGGLCTIRKKLSKWELFEARIRELFEKAQFDHAVDPYEYWYDDLGQQVDVCGGVGKHFIIMDCTTKNEPGFKSLKEKIMDNYYKKPKLEKGVASVFRGRYKHIHFVVCTEDVDLYGTEVDEAKDRGIIVVDKSLLEQWIPIVNTLGPGVKYQILEALAGARIQIEGGRKPFRYRGLRILAHPAESRNEEPRYVYIFGIDPDTLIKLAVVYRLKYMDPRGYQRDLKPGKLRLINEYLSDLSNIFPNSLLIAFDQEPGYKVSWDGERGAADDPVQAGWISIPRFYGIAEVIDGQHRLYGYIDFTEDHEFNKILTERRTRDRIVVVAIPDPGEGERPGLYLAINSTQTKISTREIWALMGETRPTTKMGFVSNIIRSLNSKGVLADEIEIPRVSRGHRSINIANLGKGISDRHLIDKVGDTFSWNLWHGPRLPGPYPAEPDVRIVGQLNVFFRCIRDAHRKDWQSRTSFLRSNNGVNVMLRVLVETLKYYRGRNLTQERINRLTRPVIKAYIEEYGADDLLADTSNEVGRERIARDIMSRMNRKFSGFAVGYLEQRKSRGRKR